MSVTEYVYSIIGKIFWLCVAIAPWLFAFGDMGLGNEWDHRIQSNNL
ncbi:hypothetical protein [Planktothricoides sp. SR001]|nr:hypothetical protein [Planktothricoides sp. SR001]